MCTNVKTREDVSKWQSAVAYRPTSPTRGDSLTPKHHLFRYIEWMAPLDERHDALRRTRQASRAWSRQQPSFVLVPAVWHLGPCKNITFVSSRIDFGTHVNRGRPNRTQAVGHLPSWLNCTVLQGTIWVLRPWPPPSPSLPPLHEFSLALDNHYKPPHF